MTRTLLALALVTPLLLAGCVSATDPTTSENGASPETGVLVEGDGWTAVFPGEVEQSIEPFPLPEVGLELEAELTLWESATDALLVQVVEFPDSDADQAAVLLESAANAGEIVDSAVLDADGTFQGRDAVVISVTQGAGDVESLAFIDDGRLYQLIHVSSDANSEHGELLALAESFQFRP